MGNGTVFDLKESQGDWFDFFESSIDLNTGKIIYDDPKPGTGRVCFRPSRPFILQQMAKRKKMSEFVLNTRSRAMERVEYIKDLTPEEEQQERCDLINYIIVDFDRLFDAEGNPIECNRENKMRLANTPVFDRFMARCMELQTNANIKQAETSGKNSETP